MGRKMSRCECGRVKSKYSWTCTACYNRRMAELKAEAISVVKTGKCPKCGQGLVRNNALTGWWQCGCYAIDRLRIPERRGLPDCSFQCFTE